jgi:hypothetical protein
VLLEREETVADESVSADFRRLALVPGRDVGVIGRLGGPVRYYEGLRYPTTLQLGGSQPLVGLTAAQRLTTHRDI